MATLCLTQTFQDFYIHHTKCIRAISAIFAITAINTMPAIYYVISLFSYIKGVWQLIPSAISNISTIINSSLILALYLSTSAILAIQTISITSAISVLSAFKPFQLVVIVPQFCWFKFLHFSNFRMKVFILQHPTILNW